MLNSCLFENILPHHLVPALQTSIHCFRSLQMLTGSLLAGEGVSVSRSVCNIIAWSPYQTSPQTVRCIVDLLSAFAVDTCSKSKDIGTTLAIIAQSFWLVIAADLRPPSSTVSCLLCTEWSDLLKQGARTCNKVFLQRCRTGQRRSLIFKSKARTCQIYSLC